MDFLTQLKKERLLIVGLGRTGQACSEFLFKRGFSLSLSDKNEDVSSKEFLRNWREQIHRLYLGEQSSKQLNQIDRVILSPGVPRTLPFLREAKNRGIPIMGEVELAYLLARVKTCIGITGTDGKTTSTYLLKQILQQEAPSYIAGNVGIPLSSILEDITPESYLILELSSYMLEDFPSLHCQVAVVLNISEDHLDRYNSFSEYREVKTRIFQNQSNSDFAILNRDEEYWMDVSGTLSGREIHFSRQDSISDCFAESRDGNNKIFFRGELVLSYENEWNFGGLQNLENTLACVSIAKALGVTNASIERGVKEFRGLRHRAEYLGSFRGIDWINDSKATTLRSVHYSLNSLGSLKNQDQNRPVILLMGGQDKGLDFQKLQEIIEKKVKTLVLFGQAREKIQSQIVFSPTFKFENLESAFQKVVSIAKSGDVVLLAPGCTSFDQYENYEERGEHFRQLFWKLKG